MKIIIATLFISFSAFAKIDGDFYSEFKRKNMDCAIEAKLSQKDINQITFQQWDELCEDQKGNSTESSLQDVMTYEKIGAKKLKVTQGKDIIEIDAKILDFNQDSVHYNFEVDTEDGLLEINESYALSGDDLTFSSIFMIEGKVFINKSGVVIRKK